MRLLRIIWARIAAEWSLQRIGRRSLREMRFRKYRARIGHERTARARLLRRLPAKLGSTVLVVIAAS